VKAREGRRLRGEEGRRRERRREVERLIKLYDTQQVAYGPPTLRPFPDADAPVSRCGTPVRPTTTTSRCHERI
jgi:hypothetical protein